MWECRGVEPSNELCICFRKHRMGKCWSCKHYCSLLLSTYLYLEASQDCMLIQKEMVFWIPKTRDFYKQTWGQKHWAEIWKIGNPTRILGLALPQAVGWKAGEAPSLVSGVHLHWPMAVRHPDKMGFSILVVLYMYIYIYPIGYLLYIQHDIQRVALYILWMCRMLCPKLMSLNPRCQSLHVLRNTALRCQA